MSSEDILPPTAPVQQSTDKPKKQSLFKKLFSKKEPTPKNMEDDLAQLRKDLGIGTHKESIQAAFEQRVAAEAKEEPVDDFPSLEEDLPQQNEITEEETNDESIETSIKSQEPQLELVAEQIPDELTSSSNLPLEEQLDWSLPPAMEEAPYPPAETVSEFDKEPKTLSASEELEQSFSSLEEQVNNIQSTVILKLKGDRLVTTIKDLKEYIESLSRKTFASKQEENVFSRWVRSHLDDENLANQIEQLQDQSLLIELLSTEIKKAKPKKVKIKQTVNSHIQTQVHFEDLKAKHEKTMNELKEVVNAKTPQKLSKIKSKKSFTFKDLQLLNSLQDVIAALSLMDEKAYAAATKKNKTAMKKWLMELSKKASKFEQLDPITLQEQLTDAINKHKKDLDSYIIEQKSQLNQEAEMLVQREDELNNQQEELNLLEQELQEKAKKLDEVKEHTKKNAQKLEQDLLNYQKKSTAFIQTYKDKAKDLASKTKSFDQQLDQKKEELENSWKKRTEDLDRREEQVIKRETIVHDKEDVLNEKERTFDQKVKEVDKHLRKREELVEGSLNKMLELDADIIAQKKEIDHMKEEVNKAGFENYLQAQLKDIDSSAPVIETKAPDTLRQRHPKVFLLIDECHEAIEEKKFAEAKTLYNKLKTKYSEEKLSEEESNLLYDAIRELYTNLHLAMLKQ